MLTALAILSLAILAPAFDPPSPSIEWSTIDGGGETSTGGNFSLTGTIAQADAQRHAGGGAFALTGGFWEGGGVTPPCISDVNDDGISDLNDFFAFLNAFDQTDYAGDVNQDGGVDLNDFFGFLNAFDAGC